jgi:hypothetical protein
VFGEMNARFGSAPPVRALEEQSFGYRLTPTSVTRRRTAASEISVQWADAA